MAFALVALLFVGAPERAGADPCPTATLDAAKALAERAASFLAASGPDIALPSFMDRAGGFVAGDLYVFVFDLEGRLRASGGWPETVGARVGIDDGAGDGIYARMRRVALEAGKGWVEYSWYNPCTRRMEPKASYLVRVGDFIVGVGAYKKPGV
ncbi:MAG TPA: cache domain-containing protein [Alphaproteobacteria bacterium]|jgi:cytochrome c